MIFIKDYLFEKYNVSNIPSLVLLNADNGEVYQYDAVRKFNNSEIENFPWNDQKCV